MRTPWGQSDGQVTPIKGITLYSTPRHGGIHLSPERIKQLPQYVTKESNFSHSLTWWEEDCDWAIIAVVFEDELRASGKYYACEENISRAKRICADWHTDFWAKWTAAHPVTSVTPASDDSELILANREF